MTMKTHIQRLAILKAQEKICNQDIADVIGKSLRYVQCVFSESDKDFMAEEIRRISRYLSDQNQNELVKCFLSPNWTLQYNGPISTTGTVDDNIAEMVCVLGRFKDSWEARNVENSEIMLQQASSILLSLVAETARIK